jgi:hypothetical protein
MNSLLLLDFLDILLLWLSLLLLVLGKPTRLLQLDLARNSPPVNVFDLERVPVHTPVLRNGNGRSL